MKRNLLLLTAVVLVAVILSGCSVLPWNWGKVEVTVEVPKVADEAQVKITNLAKNYKKEALVKLTAMHTDDFVEGTTFEWVTNDEKIIVKPTAIVEEDVTVGWTLEFQLGNKDLKVTGTVVTPEQ